MKHYFQSNHSLLSSLFVLVWMLTACGYRFPTSTVQVDTPLKNSLLQITGEGTLNNPQLTFVLRDRLQTRLGLLTQSSGASTEGKSTVLNIVLEPMIHTLVAEDSTGRSDQYRVTVRARPVVEGGKDRPSYPIVVGAASYYEPYISTSVPATRKRAEAEAMERLADTLVAILRSGLSDKSLP